MDMWLFAVMKEVWDSPQDYWIPCHEAPVNVSLMWSNGQLSRSGLRAKLDSWVSVTMQVCVQL
jgi:hypothetical protein